MSSEFALDRIREYWRDNAVKHGLSPRASWSDQSIIDKEILEIGGYLEEGDHVLDIGCANGFSTVRFAAQKNIRILGIDFISEMIALARQRLASLDKALDGRVDFKTGNILKLDIPDGSFDKVIVTRVLINLETWENQRTGLAECARVLKPGGKCLLSEATIQGWKNLNRFRKEWGLAEIPIPPFNQYLDEEEAARECEKYFRVLKIEDFSSTYYVGTRIIKPLLVKALEAGIDAANPDMEWNKWFASLPSWGAYGVQKLFVLEKL